MPPCHGGDREFDPRRNRHLCECSSMVEHHLAKVNTAVRFRSLAPLSLLKPFKNAINRMNKRFFIIFHALSYIRYAR